MGAVIELVTKAVVFLKKKPKQFGLIGFFVLVCFIPRPKTPNVSNVLSGLIDSFWFKTVLVLVALSIVLTVLYYVWVWYKNKPKPQQDAVAKPTTPSTTPAPPAKKETNTKGISVGFTLILCAIALGLAINLTVPEEWEPVVGGVKRMDLMQYWPYFPSFLVGFLYYSMSYEKTVTMDLLLSVLVTAMTVTVTYLIFHPKAFSLMPTILFQENGLERIQKWMHVDNFAFWFIAGTLYIFLLMRFFPFKSKGWTWVGFLFGVSVAWIRSTVYM
jgi:hypothetical protein